MLCIWSIIYTAILYFWIIHCKGFISNKTIIQLQTILSCWYSSSWIFFFFVEFPWVLLVIINFRISVNKECLTFIRMNSKIFRKCKRTIRVYLKWKRTDSFNERGKKIWHFLAVIEENVTILTIGKICFTQVGSAKKTEKTTS